MAEAPDEYARVLAAHLEVNPKSWEALRERGVDEDTPLQLDFEFTASDEQATRSLMRFFGTTTDYEYKGGARNQEDGSQRWMVLGTTSPMTLSLDELNVWVTRMSEDGREHGPAVFDGWGARVPETAIAARKRKRGGLLKLGRKSR
ncbi:MAG: hypothetical protein QOE31_366 [Solirubrobacteraceae bacterium]|jgi:hypothetical protein|nr:hypothetical protein [Solirubrobacteraceae bacterium]